ncbi:MAG: hotdog fold thioesterase [Dermatophilus congolensis]|nr:hotdog fold thioesterase [Dermatophilus congolensis]
MSQNPDSAPAPSTAEPGWLDVDSLNSNLGALGERMGIHFTEASLEKFVASMPVEGNTQPYGILHGGASVVLAESVGSMFAVNHAGKGRAAVGMSINAIHHRPASSGSVTATATLIAKGRTTATIQIAVDDDEGKRVCTCTLMCQLRDAPPQKNG